MGCCLGTTAVNHRRPPKSTASQPPPPPFEEETVKEVLSETPFVPKNPSPAIVNHRQILHPDEPKTETNGIDVTKNLPVEIQENVSEISEMYSYSESFSAATTATTVADTKKDEIEMEDDDEVTQKLKNKSPPVKKVARKRPMVSSGEFAVRKERGARPSARRQMAPTPEKKRQSPSRTTTNTPRYRNVGPPGDARREVTVRRSRSPVVRGEACQRRKVRDTNAAEKTNELLPVNAVESGGDNIVEKTDDGGVSPVPVAEPEPEVQASESLENPLVSLECFIFL
ncbi:hypothetical protein E3N88_06560 [Mikania micrantha]|uniref:Uncharacterized protein n=1 Tax=Mikania micrantha TaxID=192012 RepID=A0A5N6PP07_9ASTR|nr:hypothetical protein E3N88_06560 [Mikania micrantha]